MRCTYLVDSAHKLFDTMSLNIWEAAREEVKVAKEVEESKGAVTDKYVFFMGGKSSGKTTAILRFLGRQEAAKPTVALEYTYARKPNQLQGKTTGHIWELGGGTFLAKLLDIPLNIDTLHQITVVMVLDLSDAGKLWYTAETLLNAARMRLNLVIRQESRNDPNLQKKMADKSWKRLGGKDHTDSQVMDPFPVPLLIIGSKYDMLQEQDSEHRKVITKTMRFLAHYNGASLIFMSSKDEASVRGFRHIMSHATFDAELSKTQVMDGNKLYVPAGMDSFENIGNPPVLNSEISRVTRNQLEIWRRAFCSRFPQQGDDSKNLTTAGNPAKDPQFLEPLVDETRAHKDRELEAYRRQEKNKWINM